MGQYHACSFALLSAEKVLKEKVIQTLFSELDKQQQADDGSSSTADATAKGPQKHQKPNFVMGNLNAAEIEADLHRRWAIFDVQILRRAADRYKELEAAKSLDIDEAEVNRPYEILPEEAELLSRLGYTKGCTTLEFFKGLLIQLLPFTDVMEVVDFEKARTVFLRSAARIDAAKKYYVLDGHVTDHVTLLQENSKLYHYLATFEEDFKRKLAMEARRLEFLNPIIKSLNRIAFEVLHKQIAYEMGETALGLLDLKLDKLRHRDIEEGGSGVITEKNMKKAEIIKCNEYAKTAINMFAHFTFLYAQSKDRTNEHAIGHFETLPLHEVVNIFCNEPDESLISEEEVRPFLNANFLSCRIMSKIVAHVTSLPTTNTVNRAHFLVACLHRYEWLIKFVPKICLRRGILIEDIFQEEYKICQDMVKLLPSKIDRMLYLGESGLTL